MQTFQMPGISGKTNHSFLEETKTTIKLAVPIIIGQLGVMLMGVADTIQVGHMTNFAKENVGASAIANGVFITVAIIGLIALQITAPMIAHQKSEKNEAEIKNVWHSCLTVGLVLAIVCFIIIEIVAFNFHWLGQKAAIEKYAVPYLHIIAFSIFPMMLFTAIRQLSDGLADTKAAMIITLFAVVLNVALNHILIYGTAMSPQLGLNGAGWATLLSRIFMAGGLLYLLRKKYARYFPIRMFHRSHFKHLLKVGIPSGFQGFFEIAVFAFAAVLMGKLGATELAAHQIAINPASVSYMMVTGLAAAGGIRVGSNLEHPKALKRSALVALLLGFIFMAVACGIFLLANHAIAQVYISDKQVLPLAASLLIIAGFFQLSDGLQAVALGVLRGMEDVNLPTLITLVAYWLIGLPFGYYLSFYQNMGAHGIWYGLTLGLSASAVLLCWRVWVMVRRVL